MRRLALGLLLALLTGGGTLLVGHRSPPDSCKPTAPIDLDARIVGDPSSPFAITAQAVSRAGGDVEIEIVLPDGVVHLGGEKKRKARKCDAWVDVRVNDRSRRVIHVRATVVLDGATFTKVVPLTLFDGPVPTRGTPGRNSRGEALLEFSP
ncbi:MAG: hypothetical protein EHM91_06290 [Planctomycetota bacterium]|nr:MAG: hypothetical protein EHM91_06290 [Planctomycetota bacterium]